MSKVLIFRTQTKSSFTLLMLVLMIGAMVMFVTIASNQENFHPLYDAHHKSSQNLKYTADLAAKAVEPTVWACGKAGGQHENALDPITNQRPFFAFVHVYKTAGSTLRDFFRKYSVFWAILPIFRLKFHIL